MPRLPSRVVILGAGGQGRETLDILDASRGGSDEYEFLGFLDDEVERLIKHPSGPVLGVIEQLAMMDVVYAIGIGSGELRRRLDQRATGWGRVPVSLLHPSATIGADVDIGPGAIIAAGARLTTHIRVGRHFQCNLNATVSHDCEVGDYVTLSPGVHLSGNVVVGDGVTFGTGAVVIPGCRIGAGAYIGAGAVVLGDIPAGVTAVGAPARPQ